MRKFFLDVPKKTKKSKIFLSSRGNTFFYCPTSNGVDLYQRSTSDRGFMVYVLSKHIHLTIVVKLQKCIWPTDAILVRRAFFKPVAAEQVNSGP